MLHLREEMWKHVWKFFTLDRGEAIDFLNARIYNGSCYKKQTSPKRAFYSNEDRQDISTDLEDECIVPSEFAIQLSLVLAAYSGKLELLKILLRHGADPKQVNKGDLIEWIDFLWLICYFRCLFQLIIELLNLKTVCLVWNFQTNQ